MLFLQFVCCELHDWSCLIITEYLCTDFSLILFVTIYFVVFIIRFRWLLFNRRGLQPDTGITIVHTNYKVHDVACVSLFITWELLQRSKCSPQRFTLRAKVRRCWDTAHCLVSLANTAALSSALLYGQCKSPASSERIMRHYVDLY